LPPYEIVVGNVATPRMRRNAVVATRRIKSERFEKGEVLNLKN